jgi:hypothetical protein
MKTLLFLYAIGAIAGSCCAVRLRLHSGCRHSGCITRRTRATCSPRSRTFAAVMLLTASAVVASGLWGWQRWSNAKARERQLAMIRNEKVAETHAMLSAVHDRFPLGLTEERACDDVDIAANVRTPLVSFSQLRDGDVPSPAEALLRPTSFHLTRQTALEGALVAVLMTNEATVQPGSYDGWIVVFDRKATPLCHARVVAKANGGSFVDLKNQLRGAERAAAARLSPKLALEL